MRNFLKRYISVLSISFTVTILFATIQNIITGYTKNGYLLFIVQVFLFLLIALMIDYFVSLINFKRYLHYFFSESICIYPVLMSAAYLGNWFQMTLPHVLWYTGVYLLIMALLHCYYFFVSSEQAEEINEMLKMHHE